MFIKYVLNEFSDDVVTMSHVICYRLTNN